MNDNIIYSYVVQFKSAIERAKNDCCFEKDISFCNFPRACCGDTCYLLAEYLRQKGIESIYVCGDYKGQTHAWLVAKDQRVKMATKHCVNIPDSISTVIKSYGNYTFSGKVETSNYKNADINKGLIIDITADQFGEPSVYVDYLSNFYRKFKFVNAHDCFGLATDRHIELYRIIQKYIDWIFNKGVLYDSKLRNTYIKAA